MNFFFRYFFLNKKRDSKIVLKFLNDLSLNVDKEKFEFFFISNFIDFEKKNNELFVGNLIQNFLLYFELNSENFYFILALTKKIFSFIDDILKKNFLISINNILLKQSVFSKKYLLFNKYINFLKIN